MGATTRVVGVLGHLAHRSPRSLSRSILDGFNVSQESGVANGVRRFAPKIRPGAISSDETIGTPRAVFGLTSVGDWPDHQC